METIEEIMNLTLIGQVAGIAAFTYAVPFLISMGAKAIFKVMDM